MSNLIPRYWNPYNTQSFQALHERVVTVKKQAEVERTQAISGFALAFSKEQWNYDNSGLLRGHINELKIIEEALLPAKNLIEETNKAKEKPLDFPVFVKRYEDLNSDIQKLYQDSLYPFLLVLQNGQKGWNPASLICRVWDAYSVWRVQDAKKELQQLPQY